MRCLQRTARPDWYTLGPEPGDDSLAAGMAPAITPWSQLQLTPDEPNQSLRIRFCHTLHVRAPKHIAKQDTPSPMPLSETRRRSRPRQAPHITGHIDKLAILTPHCIYDSHVVHVLRRPSCWGIKRRSHPAEASSSGTYKYLSTLHPRDTTPSFPSRATKRRSTSSAASNMHALR